MPWLQLCPALPTQQASTAQPRMLLEAEGREAGAIQRAVVIHLASLAGGSARDLRAKPVPRTSMLSGCVLVRAAYRPANYHACASSTHVMTGIRLTAVMHL